MAPRTPSISCVSAEEVNEFLLLNPDLRLLEIELDDDDQIVATFCPKTKGIKDDTRDSIGAVDDGFVQRVDGWDEEDTQRDEYEM